MYGPFDDRDKAMAMQANRPTARPKMFKGCRHFFPWGIYKWHFVDEVFKVHPSYIVWTLQYGRKIGLKDGNFKDYLTELGREHVERVKQFIRDNPLAIAQAKAAMEKQRAAAQGAPNRD